jgi:hypothetical protein
VRRGPPVGVLIVMETGPRGRPRGASRRALRGGSDPPRSRSEFGEGAALPVAPELTDPLGTLEVGEHQDVKKLGAGSRAEGVQALT